MRVELWQTYAVKVDGGVVDASESELSMMTVNPLHATRTTHAVRPGVSWRANRRTWCGAGAVGNSDTAGELTQVDCTACVAAILAESGGG